MKFTIIKSGVVLGSILLSLNSCKKLLDINAPRNQVTTSAVFMDDATATSAISGVYSEMININSNGFTNGYANSIAHLSGLSADEFVAHTSSALDFQTNSLLPVNSNIKGSLWDRAYKCIYYANSIIEGLNNSTGISELVKKQIEGEAKFIRAFCHFYLVSLFGDVPIVTSTDYRINNIARRSSKDVVYVQIISDLKEAKNILADNYSFSNNERVVPNKWCAAALLARAYLYVGDWNNAEIEAASIISNSTRYNLTSSLNAVFLKNSTEAIWQLRPVNPQSNANDAQLYIPLNPTNSIPTFVSLTSSLINSFEAGDQRWLNWVASFTSSATGQTYYYPYKYKVRSSTSITEYAMVLRLAEQYLIRAEAKANQNKLAEAIGDLDIIRQRAGLSLIANTNPSISKENLLLAIERERRIELFSEWGHRWLDLKRTNRANAVLGPLKAPNWQITDMLYPLPQIEINNNPNLTQNEGY